MDGHFQRPPWTRQPSKRRLDPCGQIIRQTLQENESLIRKYNELSRLRNGALFNTRDIRLAILDQEGPMGSLLEGEGAQSPRPLNPRPVPSLQDGLEPLEPLEPLEAEAILEYDPGTDSRHDMIFGNIMGHHYGEFGHGTLWSTSIRATSRTSSRTSMDDDDDVVERLVGGDWGCDKGGLVSGWGWENGGVEPNKGLYRHGPSLCWEVEEGCGGCGLWEEPRPHPPTSAGKGIWADVAVKGRLKEAAILCGAITCAQAPRGGDSGSSLRVLHHRGGMVSTASSDDLLHEREGRMGGSEPELLPPVVPPFRRGRPVGVKNVNSISDFRFLTSARSGSADTN